MLKKINLLCFTATFTCFVVAKELPRTVEEVFEAAKQGDVETFEGLIGQGEVLNHYDSEGNSLVHIAAQHGHAHIVELLAQYDADLNWLMRLWRYFSKRKPSLDAQNKKGETALHSALDSEKLDALEALLKNGANPDILNKENETALISAVEKDKRKHTICLMNICNNYHMHTKNGGNILQVALTKDHRELAKAIIIEHNIIMSKNPDLAKRNNLTEAQN